jgi:hypothetical protein
MDTAHDPVREYLKTRGCAAEVLERGLEGLVAEWELIAEGLEGQGYVLGLDDYLNDMDARDILEGALRVLEPAARTAVKARVEAADHQVLEATDPCADCLWGDELAESHHWSPGKQWWYYRVPRDRSLEFSGDLEATGIRPEAG